MAKNWKYSHGNYCQNCDEETNDLQDYSGVFICDSCVAEQEEFAHYGDVDLHNYSGYSLP